MFMISSSHHALQAVCTSMQAACPNPCIERVWAIACALQGNFSLLLAHLLWREG